MKDKRVKSAEIIQRNFRKYLHRRKVSCNTENESKCINKISDNNTKEVLGNCGGDGGENQNNEVSNVNVSYKTDLNNSKLNVSSKTKVQEIQKQIHDIYIELNKFYINSPICNNNLKQQDDTSQDINRIISNLSSISKIDDCKGLNAENITEEARLKHQDALNNLTVKWWQNLNDI